MKTYYFGCLGDGATGHFLYHENLTAVGHYEKTKLPFRYQILDGSMFRPDEPQEQGKWRMAYIGGITIFYCWDRTGDSRGNSNSAFLYEGQFNEEQCVNLTKEKYPKLWERITKGVRAGV